MATVSAAATAPGPRLAAIDLIRGVAVGAMIVYHASWDLSANGLIATDVVSEPGWRAFARLIAGTFLALVGFNLVLAARRGFRAGPYLRRLAIIIAAALAVSAATYWFMPETFVFFGMLHSIAVASVLALPFLWAPAWLTAIAAAFCFAAPALLSNAFFSAPGWLWLGLSPESVPTVDYVPVFPWFGVVLAGVGAGKLFCDHARGSRFAEWRISGALPGFVATAGRWSLPIYLIHQPILIGVLFFAAPLIGPSTAALTRNLVNEYRMACAAEGYDRDTCDAYADCVVSALAADQILERAFGNALTASDRDRWLAHVTACRPKNPPPLIDNQL